MRPKFWTGILAGLAVLLVAWVVLADSAYVIILKNGSRLMAKKPPEVDGNRVIITLFTGTLASYRADQVDFGATKKANKDIVSVWSIDELTVRFTQVPTPTARQPLADSIKLVGSQQTQASIATPTPTPTPGIGLQQMAYSETRVDKAFAEFFDDRKLFLYRTSRGTRPEYFFVQIVTDSDEDVFEVLQAVADGYAEICDLNPEIAPLALELEMVSPADRPAGTFRITPEQAMALATNEISPREFFRRNVIFK